MQPIPQVLLLDVMGTLVHDPSYREGLDFLGLSLEEFLAAADREAWGAFERGEIDEEAYFRRMFMDRRPVDGDGLRQALVDGYRWLDGMEELVMELSAAGVKMHALSNYPRWYRRIEDKLRLSRYLRWSFVSCETGRRKPSPEVYLDAAATLGVATSDCLFVDDREKNCAGARGTGMRVWRFEGVEGLREELRRQAVL
ncbi:MAG: HAD-IA family hydrolase [Acidobacteriota bacterium]|nr:HAD-IA family hydrolase [Acidobacteriota bacterium]